MKTVRLEGDKYEFDIDDRGLMAAARRHGEDWPAGLELQFTNCFIAALNRILELENQLPNRPDTDHIARVYARERSIPKAAKALCVSERTLCRWLKQYPEIKDMAWEGRKRSVEGKAVRE